MSINQLAVNLQRHSPPDEFEQQFLGWPAPSNESVLPRRKRERPAGNDADETEALA